MGRILMAFLLAFMLLPVLLLSQWQLTLENKDYYIVGMRFLNDSIGFAGGLVQDETSDSAAIFTTYDAGSTWEPVMKTKSASPWHFAFVNDSLLFSGGQDGIIFRSIDGGLNWEFLTSLGSQYDVFTIDFFNDSVGIASKAITHDGGYTWEPIDMSMSIPRDLCIVDDTTAFVSSHSGLYRTNDMGETWLKIDTGFGVKHFSVFMVDDQLGYATREEGGILKTLDGGNSWDLVFSNSLLKFKKIRFVTSTTGYVLAATDWDGFGSARVLRTDDGGYTWEYVFFGCDYANVMAALHAQTLVVPQTDGKFFRTTNGGGIAPQPKHIQVDWYELLHSSVYLKINGFAMDINNSIYLGGEFRDSLFINDEYKTTSVDPYSFSSFILKFSPWGVFLWGQYSEIPGEIISVYQCVTDASGNLVYTIRKNSDTLDILKSDPFGNKIWSKQLIGSWSSNNHQLSSTEDESIFLSGIYNDTLSFEGQSLVTGSPGIFLLKLDSDGNVVNLDHIAHTSYPYLIYDYNHAVNADNDICFAVYLPGGLIFEDDTLGTYGIQLLCLDENLDLLWHSNEMNSYGQIEALDFHVNSDLFLQVNSFQGGNNSWISTFDEEGNVINSLALMGENHFTTMKLISNQRILTAGRLEDFSIFEGDTIYGFHPRANSFLYTLSSELELIKSRQISGTFAIEGILENNNNTILIGEMKGLWDVFFENDTIIHPGENSYFISRINSIITDSPNSEEGVISGFNVYPNPSNGIFHIQALNKINNSVLLKLFSIEGKLIHFQSFPDDSRQLDVRQQPDGTYYLQIETEKSIEIKKIIKQ